MKLNYPGNYKDGHARIDTFVDAAVSGRISSANPGNLSLKVSHSKPGNWHRVGKRILNCGSLMKSHSAWTGAKTVHNYITLPNNLVATEGMAIGLKYGIGKETPFKCTYSGRDYKFEGDRSGAVPGLVLRQL